jgi:aconitate hydratase 2 / 2-methylisocitrate dehydratase
MVGGYNVHPLIELLDDAEVATVAGRGAEEDAADVRLLQRRGRKGQGRQCRGQGRDAELGRCRVVHQPPRSADKKITVTVFKVPGETNTDDLSPAPDAWSRPDIPLHYLAMLKNTRPDAAFKPEEDGKRGPMQFIEDLKKKGHLVAYVGDVVGTGSSRKSATNSVIWATGQDIPFVPNKRFGGVPGRQDRPDLLQHAGRLRLAADRSGRVQAGNGRRDRRATPTTARSSRTAKPWPSSSSRATCCSTKCAPAAAST